MPLPRQNLTLIAAAISLASTSSAPNERTSGDLAAGDSARLVLLGTGTPIPDPERSGPAQAIVIGKEAYVVDVGAGVVRRAMAAAQRDSLPALRAANLRRVFITHLHSDHTLGLPDIMLTPAVAHRKGPLMVYGPPGTRAMVAKILEAYREDIDLRIHGLERGDANAYRVITHEVSPGMVYRDSNVTVTAFRVPHGSWRHAFGYRFDAKGRSIVISGDTGPSEAIVEACHGCDVLVHEVYSLVGYVKSTAEWQKYITSFHTSTKELGALATQAKAKTLVLYHQMYFGGKTDTEANMLKEIRAEFKGRVISAHDLDVY